MKYKRRIISLILVFQLLASLVSNIAYVYADEYNGTGSGAARGSTGANLTWSTSYQGYRISIVDMNAKLVGTPVDLLFAAEPDAYQMWTIKTEPFQSRESENKVIQISNMLNSEEFKGINSMPTPMIWSGGAVGNGVNLRNWMMDGKESINVGFSTYPINNTSITTNNKAKGNNNNSGQRNTQTPSNAIQTIPPSNTSETANKTDQVLEAHKKYYKEQYNNYSNAVLERAKYFKNDLDYNYEETLTGLIYYTSELSSKLSDDSELTRYEKNIIRMQMREAWKSITESKFKSLSIDNGQFNLFNLAYALEDKVEKQYILNILSYTIEGENAFQFNMAGQNHITKPTVVQTIAANKYKVIIEPIIWFTPYGFNKPIYGTVTNIFQWCYLKIIEGYTSHTNSSGTKIKNYENTFGSVAPHCLELSKDFIFDNRVIKAPQKAGAITIQEMCDTSVGYAMHIYGAEGGNPSGTQTYDNKDYPHPAPDPTLIPVESTEDKRIFNISKTYVEKTKTDEYKHIGTYVRETNPYKIDILNEPDYYVTEYFRSKTYIKPLERTEWDEIVNLNDCEDYTLVNERDPGVKIVGTVELDENNTTLYVRLEKRVEEPSTHTWDSENYSGGEPGPAPNDVPSDPSQAKSRIVKVYEEQVQGSSDIKTIAVFERTPTVQQIKIEDEPVYKLVEWKHGTPNNPVGTGATWSSVTNGVPNTKRGTSQTTVKIDEGSTLYVRLRKVEALKPLPANEDLTESQLTKLSRTNSTTFNWSGYTFGANIPAARTSHGYSYHITYSPEHEDDSATCSDMTRSRGDNYVSATFAVLHQDKHETSIINNKAHTSFAGSMYGKGGLKKEEILFDEHIGDGAYSWTLNSDGSTSDGIEYITTLSRASINDNMNLAQYKKNAMDATSYTRVNSIFPAANKTTATRKSNGNYTESILYQIGHKTHDNLAISSCAGCGCPSHHTTDTDSKNVIYDIEKLDLSTNKFKIWVYGRNADKTVDKSPVNRNGYRVAIMNTSTSYSSLFTKKQTAGITFNPYIKMSYQITNDIDSFPGYNAEPNQANSRTVYMLAPKKSTIVPSNAVEVGWVNSTQDNGAFGLQMTSQQWSVHSMATNGTAIWRKKTQVLPGGALYMLSTKNTESYIQTITYNTLVEDSDRSSWVSVADSNIYTLKAIIKSNTEYLNEAKNVIENYRVVQWVNSDLGTGNNSEKAWTKAGTAVKIVNGGEDLKNIGLSGNKASTDSKYRLTDGTTDNSNAASEADIDIEAEIYSTRVYKVFSDVYGNIYVTYISIANSRKMLDEDTLNKAVNALKAVNGTNIPSTISGLSSDMTYAKPFVIGNKVDNTDKIIQNLQANYNYLYQLDVKTNYITNTINSVERNTGDDKINATWVSDGKWYNEAFDGYYEVVQTAVFKVGLQMPNVRVSVLDPNLCPSAGSKGEIYTNAYVSQFCMDTKSTVAKNEEDGYIGTFEGTKVYMVNPELLYYTRPFYIPNATVQDIT